MSDEYIALFHRYIARAIESLYAHIGPELQELSSETREQAWHLLDYGLKLTHGWEMVCKLLLTLAPRMERDGFRHEWLPYLENGVALSRRVQDVSGEAQLSLYIGRLYRLRGELPTANTWLLASAALHGQLGNHAERAKALNQLAYVARLQNRYAAVKEYVDEALNLLDESDTERATSYWVLGTVAQSQLKWAEAEPHHLAALQIWQSVGDQRRAAWSLQNLGEVSRGMERYDEATNYIQQAIALLGQLHDPVNEAIARMSLGIVYIYRKDAGQALALFHLAESVFRQVGDQLNLALVYTNMTIVQRDLGHFRAAVEDGKNAIRLWEILADFKMMANAEDELGLTYLDLEQYAEAIKSFRQGLEHLVQVASDPFREMIHNSLLSHLEKAQQVGSG